LEYRGWVEGYARNRKIPILKAQKGVSKEDAVRPYLQRMERRNRHGVYCIFTSMEMGSTFTSKMPKFPTEDPNYRIIRRVPSSTKPSSPPLACRPAPTLSPNSVTTFAN
jgi:predicted nucleotidyltransferase